MGLIINSWEFVHALISDPGLHTFTGRKREEFRQLLRFLRFRVGLQPPFEIEGREGPDFLVRERATNIGIELTWAAKQLWEQAEANVGNNPISRNWFEKIPKDCLEEIEKKGGKALGRYLEGRRSYSPCWHPREYTEAKELEVQKAIVKKTDDFAKPGYQKFDQNWLLIMDRKPFHFADIDELLENVRGSISWGTIKFDALFFVTQVRNRALKKNEEALCQLSESHCQVIGRVAGG